MKEFFQRFSANRSFYLIAYALIILAAIIGFINIQMYGGRAVLGFYMGFTLSMVVLFSLYSIVEFIFKRGRQG